MTTWKLLRINEIIELLKAIRAAKFVTQSSAGHAAYNNSALLTSSNTRLSNTFTTKIPYLLHWGSLSSPQSEGSDYIGL